MVLILIKVFIQPQFLEDLRANAAVSAACRAVSEPQEVLNP